MGHSGPCRPAHGKARPAAAGSSSRPSTASAPGAFEIVVDHDPRPLSYQFSVERAGTFSWEYLAEGPELWRVRIGRTGEAAAS